MYKTDLIVLILIGAVLFAVGAGLGVFYQTQKDALKIAAVDSLSSEAVPSIVAYGRVTGVKGRNVTLTFNNTSLTIPIAQDAQVSSFSSASVEQKVDFSQIKNGDYINISVKLSPDGKLAGKTVIILPSVGFPAQ